MASEVWIIDGIRTPIGKYGGSLKNTRADDLAALLLSEIIKRNNIDPKEVEDVILGCTNQGGEDSRNVARMSLLIAGFPVEVAGSTVNRLCGSAMEAVHQASRAILTGDGNLFIAGGTENMTRAPFVFAKPKYPFPRGSIEVFDSTIGWRFTNPKLAEKYHPYSMGETAENLASKYKISREEQDRFAFESHKKATKSIEGGNFKNEIIPVPVPEKKGQIRIFDTDEQVRPDTSLEKLSKLRPIFKKNGSVTAGNSTGINDGSAVLLLASPEKAKELGLHPMARILGTAVSGVHPDIMGIGPVPATQKVLKRTGLKLKDIGLVEINEAFAVQVLACLREMEIPEDILNVQGGAIALGHPLGSTGARIIVTLIHEMKRRKVQYGLATMCIGVGQGIATVVERME